MNIITKREIVASAVDRWVRKYSGYQDTGDKYDKGPITEKLKKLPLPHREKDINRIIGNNSWTELLCSECGNDVDAVAEFDINCGEYSYLLCYVCLKNAASIVKVSS